MMTRRAPAFGVVALLIATLCWAGNYIVGAAVIDRISPLDLTAVRWAIAAVPLVVLAAVIERPNWRAVAARWPVLLLGAVLGLLGYNLLLYSALERTTAISASLINAFNPAMITVAAAVFLRERLTPLGVCGIVLALWGVLWVLSDGDIATLMQHGFGTGEALMVAAIAVWTAYTLLGRRTRDIPPITAVAAQAVLVVVVLAPFVVVTGGPHVPPDPGVGWALVFIGLFPSVVSYVMWNAALRALPPARAGVFLNLLTVFTVLISVVFLGEQLTLAEGLGGLVVLGGVFLANIHVFRRRHSAAAPG